MITTTLPNLSPPTSVANSLPSTKVQHAVTAVLIGASIGLAFLTDVVVLPYLNSTVAYIIPVLIGLVRASSRGVRVIVALTILLEFYTVSIPTVAPTTWFSSYATLTAICYLALRFSAQRDEILQLNREAVQHADRAEVREQQIGELVNTLYHEVRQPIAMARMHVDAVQEALVRNERSWTDASIKAIDEALDLTTTMIKDLVESARLEAGQLLPKPTIVDIGEFMAAFLGHQMETLDVNRVNLKVSGHAEALVDPRHLESCLANLLSNALKYSEEDQPVTVRVSESPTELLLSITDDGIGITAEEISRLFTRGYRTPEAVRVAEGTGLGLYITKLLVEVNHGRVWVESTPGQGSTFYLALPLP